MNPPFLSTRAVIYFSANPTEELTSIDLAIKFGVDAETVSNILRPAVARGLLSVQGGRGRYRPNVYRAGPGILQVLGRAPERMDS